MQLSREIHPRVRWLMKKPIAVLWSIKNGYRNTLTLGQQKMGKSFIGSLRQIQPVLVWCAALAAALSQCRGRVSFLAPHLFLAAAVV